MAKKSEVPVLGDVVEFSRKTMEWCQVESERAATTVAMILELLVEDAQRVARMSATTLAAVKELRVELDRMRQRSAGVNSDTLMEGLKKLMSEHSDVKDFVYPIVETLQFQDRIRQNMDNLAKAMSAWRDERAKIVGGRPVSADQLTAFGAQLVKCTTMLWERDMIRRHISGLPSEEKVEDVQMF